MTGIAPQVFTIPAGTNFARALSRGIIARVGRDPLHLSDVLILVPTRRAARTLHDAFAAELGGASLGPRVQALGDEPDDAAFEATDNDIAGLAAIAPLRRALLLATLVHRHHEASGRILPFAQAVRHAGELSSLLDEAIAEGVDLARLKTLAPDAYAEHWQDVAKFLAIVAEHWPDHLKSLGMAEPAAKRDNALRALARHLQANPPKFVVAAGSTGSIPATAELLKVISRLEGGAVVLPSLDTECDDDTWSALDASHGQFGMKHLLEVMEVPRDEVKQWADPAAPNARVRFLSEALRPPPTTDAWRTLITDAQEDYSSALEQLAIIDAPNPREEALVIAVALREVLQTQGKTAALVTPDRNLARRVASELRRWDIAIDDSGGTPLSRTPPGALLTLLARVVADKFAPIPLLALLKHPLVSAKSDRAGFLAQVRALDIRILRGPRPGPGLFGIENAIRRHKDTHALLQWWQTLSEQLSPLAEKSATTRTVSELVEALEETAEILCSTPEKSGAQILWRGDAGDACAALFRELLKQNDIEVRDAADFAELLRDLLDRNVVRPAFGTHPRLALLGPLEARLQSFDLVVLGGLNEGTWPGDAATDPFLSRPMRAELGLNPPERRIGLAAHDFFTLAAQSEVLLTRANKQDGSPTIPSRWVLRVRQLAQGLGLAAKLDKRNTLLRWAEALDAAPRTPREKRPAPKPPVRARPRSLRVTEIETWRRDPYAIYARHVLRLAPLDAIDEEPGPSQRGTAIHAALENFVKQFPDSVPDDALEHILRFGEEAFAKSGAGAAHLALWRPRFARAMRWFLAWHKARLAMGAQAIVEVTGELAIPSPGGVFTLRGRADRIDILPGGAAILDYKTGTVPSDTQVKTLFAPQLPLEGAMLKQGAFGGIRAGTIEEFIHIKLTGTEPAGALRIFADNADEVADEALAFLKARIITYDDPKHGYMSRANPFRVNDSGDYDHLARAGEWLLGDEE